jgi:hypothetical protein
VYVGLTTNTVEWRWERHKQSRNSKDTLIARAIRELGTADFEVHTIGEAYSRYELKRMEGERIRQFDALNPEKGFNMMPPNGGGSTPTPELKQRISDGVKASCTPERRDDQSQRRKESNSERNAALRASMPDAEYSEYMSSMSVLSQDFHWRNNPDKKASVLAKRTASVAKRNEGKENRKCEFCQTTLTRRVKDLPNGKRDIERWSQYNKRRFCNQQCTGKAGSVDRC